MDQTTFLDATFTTGFFGLFCKSELLNLRWEDILEILGGLKILITESKTSKKAVYIHISSKSDNLYPVKALKILHNTLPLPLGRIRTLFLLKQ